MFFFEQKSYDWLNIFDCHFQWEGCFSGMVARLQGSSESPANKFLLLLS